ncbi:MAG: ATP-binding cassette domain-containing protein [Candidatus Euphemobacter frigidus]|nr:ATP-binding cassette domain-containing protein [Candidatus Euphemobacter frigidus]MDP8275634.1 ATP-binding cassette domain-containing protein [Candidatus Euphemobacter frigidus]
MEKRPIIEVRDLVAGYGREVVLRGISFDVYPGEILVVLGASGCGKSTLLKLLVGLLKPMSGSIRYWGKDIKKMDEDELDHLLHKIGLSFQDGALFNSMTVGENVALPMVEYGNMDRELIPILARMKLSLVGLTNSGYLMPEALSGGMKKRVGFARAIAIDPTIVFFDEPSAGLDPITAAGLDKIILDIRRLMELTMVVVTHELDSIRSVADRVIMLDWGEIIFDGTLAQIETADHPRVRQFFERIPDKTIL